MKTQIKRSLYIFIYVYLEAVPEGLISYKIKFLWLSLNSPMLFV